MKGSVLGMLMPPRLHKVLRAFPFVGTCNKSSLLVDLKVLNMLLDQNQITAVFASTVESARPIETETGCMLFADQLCLTHRGCLQGGLSGFIYCKSTVILISPQKEWLNQTCVLLIKLCAEALAAVPVIVRDSPRVWSTAGITLINHFTSCNNWTSRCVTVLLYNWRKTQWLTIFRQLHKFV